MYIHYIRIIRKQQPELLPEVRQGPGKQGPFLSSQPAMNFSLVFVIMKEKSP